jgi:hypothetical protein
LPAAVGVRDMLTNFIDTALKHMQTAQKMAEEKQTAEIKQKAT